MIIAVNWAYFVFSYSRYCVCLVLSFLVLLPPLAPAQPSKTENASATATTKASAESDSAEQLLTNVRQVTFAGQRAGEGYFSQDSSLLVFQSEREPENPFFQIYLADLATGETHRVSPGY